MRRRDLRNYDALWLTRVTPGNKNIIQDTLVVSLFSAQGFNACHVIWRLMSGGGWPQRFLTRG